MNAQLGQKHLPDIILREATIGDTDALCDIEMLCFESDRLSKRRLKHWIKADNAVLLVASAGAISNELQTQHALSEGSNSRVVGYALLITRKGSRSGRLYSIAVLPNYKGLGIAKRLIEETERCSVDRGMLFLRLEVSVSNHRAVRLYEMLGYKRFGIFHAYYEDGADALRMQKPIRQLWKRKVAEHELVRDNEDKVEKASVESIGAHTLKDYPWYQQTTDFTCGAASLMMAAKSLDQELTINQSMELDIWRKATTIYMTSGHGGTHPVGLGLYAQSLGFQVRVYLSTEQPLFVDGVRNEHKKQVIEQVNDDFMQAAKISNLPIYIQTLSVAEIKYFIAKGHAVMGLISTYQFDGKKAPHWVCFTQVDDICLYLHDPDADFLDAYQGVTQNIAEIPEQTHMDFQHIPIALEDYERLSSFGKNKLRTTIVLSN